MAGVLEVKAGEKRKERRGGQEREDTCAFFQNAK